MKKHSLLMLLPLALIVTACNGSLKKGSIFNEKFMKANFAPDVEKSCEFVTPKRVDLDIGEFDNFYPGGAGQQDLIYITRGVGVFGAFSVLENKYVLPIEEYKGGSYKCYASGGIRFPYAKKVIETQDYHVLYDEYGNKIFEGKCYGYLPTFEANIVEFKKGENLRKEIRVKEGSKVLAHAFYNIDGSFKEVLTPEEYGKRFPHGLMVNSTLKNYGHPELIKQEDAPLNNARRIKVYNTEKEKFVSSFSIPTLNTTRFTIGDYIYYQTVRTPQEREKKYDYFDGNKKIVETYRVNYLNGKVESVKTNIVFNLVSPTSLYDEKNQWTCLLLTGVREIQKDKTLAMSERSIIVDQKFNEVADVSGIDFLDITPLGDYWYVDNIVYDSKMNEVGYITGTVDPDEPRIVHGSHGFGLVDFTGKFIVEPTFEAISMVEMGDEKTEIYSAMKGNELKLFKVEQEKATLISTLDTDKYTVISDLGSNSHYVVQENETSKYFLIDVLSGSLTEYAPVAAEDYDFAYPETFKNTVRDGTLKYSINLYRKGTAWFAIVSETKINKSFRLNNEK